MAYIGAEPVPGQNREVDDISSGFNGNATAFTLQVSSVNVSPESANNILINLGGVLQNPGTDYTIAASTITFTTAPAAGLSFFGLILGAGINTATVADDTIGPSKLIDTAVTAGSYTTADITVDAQGRVTAAANGTIATAEIADGAVNNAKINASAAIAASKIADFVTGNTNNRVLTATGTANSLNGEASLTFDGSTLVVTPTSSDARVTILGSEGNDARLSLISDDGDDHIDQYNLRVAASNNRFYIDQFESGAFQERFTIANGGNVGIGNNSPSDKLHVRGASADFTSFILDNATNSSGSYKITFGDQGQVNHLAVANREMTFGTNNAERMRIDSSGRVGIGTTSPSANLHLKDGSGNTELKLQGGASTANNVIAFLNSAGSTRGNITYDTDNNFVLFNVNTSERMRIDSSGRLLIGLTSGTGAKLMVDQGAQVFGAANDANNSCLTMDYSSGTGRVMGHGSSGGTLSLFTNASGSGVQESMRITNPSAQTTTAVTIFKPQAASNVQSHMIHFIVGGHERGAITAGSSFGSTPAFSSISDYRVKTNIRDYTDGWNNIKSLPVKLFDINKEGEEATDIKGWIAHEVQAVIPEAVTGTKDAKKEDGSDEYQSLGYGMFMPDVVSALQTAIAKIEELETKVAALEAA